MLFYFSLQYTLFKRRLSDFGFNPFIGQWAVILIFIAASVILFKRTDYAPYIMVLAGLYATSLSNETKRTGFLKSIYTDHQYGRIRLAESLLLISPFALVLILYHQFWLGIFLAVLAGALSLINLTYKVGYKVRTPFSKYPYEFTVGFRNTYVGVMLAYFLMLMSMKAGNFNLGIFSIGLIVMICMSYYGELEDDYYIWVHKATPQVFLWTKLKRALVYCTWLDLPIVILTTLYFPDHFKVPVLIFMLGLLYLSAMIFGKYAAYPSPFSIPQAILLGSCIFLPPLLLLIIPYFYTRASGKLSSIL
jgi:hypothetical protein